MLNRIGKSSSVPLYLANSSLAHNLGGIEGLLATWMTIDTRISVRRNPMNEGDVTICRAIEGFCGDLNSCFSLWDPDDDALSSSLRAAGRDLRTGGGVLFSAAISGFSLPQFKLLNQGLFQASREKFGSKVLPLGLETSASADHLRVRF